jgi:hypothetical protein
MPEARKAANVAAFFCHPGLPANTSVEIGLIMARGFLGNLALVGYLQWLYRSHGAGHKA